MHDDDMRAALEHEEVRRIFMRIFSISNIMKTSYSENPVAMAFNEGLRAVGLRLKADMDNVDGEAFARMLIEERRSKKA